MEQETLWKSVEMYCPNCGKKITGYKNKYGMVKMECGRCRCAIVSVKKSVRRYEMTVVIKFPIRIIIVISQLMRQKNALETHGNGKLKKLRLCFF